MNRIDAKFRELKRDEKKAFIPFLTVGYPSLGATERLVLEFEKSGASLIELGVPFSDPIADGPIIQAASHAALKNRVSLRGVLSLVRRLRVKTQVPLAAMTYFNPVLSYGLERFIRDACDSGLDAVIIPDLPPEEEPVFLKKAKQAGLCVILFVAPTTSESRLKLIVRAAKGFLYFVSVTGVTGARRKLPADIRTQIASVKRIAGKLPVCVGFGVSEPLQVRALAQVADGVIVGSAIVAKIREYSTAEDMVGRVSRFVEKLAREARLV